MNAVRLCFQTYLKKDKLVPLKPVVSQPIYDKKSNTDLIIVDLSDTSSVATGGKKIIILCEKVVKEDISIRFYEEIDGVCVWEAYGEFAHKNVHRQTAISFKTPAYKIKDIENAVNVFVQLQRPSDKMTSEPLQFQFTPDPNGNLNNIILYCFSRNIVTFYLNPFFISYNPLFTFSTCFLLKF